MPIEVAYPIRISREGLLEEMKDLGERIHKHDLPQIQTVLWYYLDGVLKQGEEIVPQCDQCEGLNSVVFSQANFHTTESVLTEFSSRNYFCVNCKHSWCEVVNLREVWEAKSNVS